MATPVHTAAGGNQPAERWLCEQLQRARFDLTTRVLPSRHPPGFDHSRGPFEDYDLHYVASGAIEYAFPHRVIRAKAGEFCLLGPGLTFVEREARASASQENPGATRATGGIRGTGAASAAQGRGASLIYVHFTLDAAGRNPLDVLDLPAVIRPRAQSSLGQLCRQALRDSVQSSQGAGWSYVGMKGRFVTLLGALLQEGLRAGDLRLNPARLGPDWLWPVLQKIDEDLSSSALTLPALATVATLSPSHFTHQFRRYMGLSPMQFLMQRRMNLACDLLLAKQNLSIKEVSQRCGFTDPYHFSAQFKRQIRQSPTSFRVRH